MNDHEEPVQEPTKKPAERTESPTEPVISPPREIASIFLAVVTVAPFLLSDEVDTIGRRLGLLCVALPLSVVLHFAIRFWDQTSIRLLISSVAVFLVAFSVFSWFVFLRDRDDQLQSRIHQLEQDNNALRQDTADLKARIVELEGDIKQAEDTLLSFVGPGVKETCTIARNSYYFGKSIVAIDCTPQGVAQLSMAIYRTVDLMNVDYMGSLQGSEGVSGNSLDNCRRNRPGQGEFRNETTGRIAGRVFCSIVPNRGAWIEWAYDQPKIYAYATREDNNIRALYEWWESAWPNK